MLTVGGGGGSSIGASKDSKRSGLVKARECGDGGGGGGGSSEGASSPDSTDPLVSRCVLIFCVGGGGGSSLGASNEIGGKGCSCESVRWLSILPENCSSVVCESPDPSLL